MEEIMGKQVWRILAFALLGSGLLQFAGIAQAVTLEKIEVASHLGEPLFAEVPLKLEANELASKVFVEIAAPSDYKIFEVYRDPVLKLIRADVASDERGVRVKLTSRSTIKSPFFNLVLKIRYGRVSHFKKFPVFLDTAKSIQHAASQAPQPSVKALANESVDRRIGQSNQPTSQVAVQSSLTESAGRVLMPKPAAPVAVKPEVTHFDGWARTGRYGPIVRGDNLSTVAQRLRVDHRYSLNQVMQGLFEKNVDSFDQHNINLMKAGTLLNVPTAAEIEQHNKSEAMRFMIAQQKAWKQLTQQPRYAAEEEAQRTRYSKRISMGERAGGMAAAPVAATETTTSPQSIQPASQDSPSEAETQANSTAADAGAVVADQAVPAAISSDIAAIQAVQNETAQAMIRLQEQNEILKQQLMGTQKSIEVLTQKVDKSGADSSANARTEKLAVMIASIQSQLKQMQQQSGMPVAGMNWVTWLLVALVVLLLAVVAMLMRRELAHPADAKPSEEKQVAGVPADATSSDGKRIESEETDAPHVGAGVDAASVTGVEHAGDTPLSAVIEHEVAGIETGESIISAATESTGEALPSFSDELSDTDTAELEPYIADAEMIPDSDIDYVAEADVYIRYGMEDEAMKQLDMALRLQPDNVDAHIRKAELLLDKSDRQGFDETLAAATMTLAADDLERFKSAVEQLGNDIDLSGMDVVQAEASDSASQFADNDPNNDLNSDPNSDDLKRSPEQDQPGGADIASLDVPDEDDELDFDLASLEMVRADLTGEMAPSELDADQSDDVHDDEPEDMPWLQDADVADEDAGQLQADEAVVTDLSDADLVIPDMPVAEQPDTSAERIDDDVHAGATQELGHLLSEFSQQDDEQDAPVQNDLVQSDSMQIDPMQNDPMQGDALSAASLDSYQRADRASDDQSDLGATQHLDALLSEFDDDDDGLDFIATEGGFDASVDAPSLSHTDEPAMMGETIAIDSDHQATQELDSLLAEFADEDGLSDLANGVEGLDASFFEAADDEEEAEVSIEIDHGATQELDHLLSEFALEVDESEPVDADMTGLDAAQMSDAALNQELADSGFGEGATQVLGRLLDEFNDDDSSDDEDHHKKS